MSVKIAVAGAGIYGATVATRLAELGHSVDLYDPLGVLRAASAINQHRVHAGYHYPRDAETIAEIQQCRAEFHRCFQPAIVAGTLNYYAIPQEGSRTPPAVYEEVMERHGLPLTPCAPAWMNFRYIQKCYQVDEQIYDSTILRRILEDRIRSRGVRLHLSSFLPGMRAAYDVVVWALYGLGPSRSIFHAAKYQVAEKVLIRPPAHLRGICLVVVDGPFTAFDAYGNSAMALFGSALHTNHWSTVDPDFVVPPQYAAVLNGPSYVPVPFTHFEILRRDCCLAVPDQKDAVYIGSRFTMRVVEDDPAGDRRTLRVTESAPGEFHIFSGKVVGAVKAAQLICERIANHAGTP